MTSRSFNEALGHVEVLGKIDNKKNESTESFELMKGTKMPVSLGILPKLAKKSHFKNIRIDALAKRTFGIAAKTSFQWEETLC